MKLRTLLMCLLIAVTVLSGCHMTTVDQLYSPPLRSEGYTNLQTVMQSTMEGCTYAAPQSGEYQQTVQMADLDGDGQPEFLLFAKDSSAQKPLRIFIFSGDGKTYHLQDTIECAGTAFDKVDYVQMNHFAGVELVVGYQVSDQVLRSVSVYTMKNGKAERILTNHYSGFLCADLNDNGLSDLFVFHPDPDNSEKAVAECFGIRAGTMYRSESAQLSASVDKVKRILVSKLNDGATAVYMASGLDDNTVITDVLTLDGQKLLNVSLSSETGNSVQTLRNSCIYADDIDNDGVLELPDLISTAATEGTKTNDSQFVIRWYALNLDGSEKTKQYTYHNLEGRWYLQIGSDLAKQLVVTRKGSSYEFGLYQPDHDPVKLMTLYVLTGQKREEQAHQDNRFTVYKNETTIYAVKLEVSSAEYGMTQERIVSGFHLIVQDWNAGMT